MARRSAERATESPAMRPAWVTCGRAGVFGAGEVECGGDWAGREACGVVVTSCQTVIVSGMAMVAAVVVSDRGVESGTAELLMMMMEAIGLDKVWNSGWYLGGQPSGRSQASMEQQPTKLLTAQS